tara:strand:+ start:135 stop:692 length:558 start_codon:yes stop_codon:yes gene_type:complete
MQHWTIIDTATSHVLAQIITPPDAMPQDCGWDWDAATQSAYRVDAPGDPACERFDVATQSWVSDLTGPRLRAMQSIDAAAEAVRMQFLTGGAGQALTYQRKEAEARAWSPEADPSAFPMLVAEATATDATLADTVTLVIAQADAWATVGAAIEGARMGAKKAVREAENAAEIEAAAAVNWEAVIQ